MPVGRRGSSERMLAVESASNRSVRPPHFVPPAPPFATVAISFTAVALALFGLPLVAPRDSDAQETTARDQGTASTAQVKWQGPLAPDVAWVLGSYYGPAQVRTTASSGCSADDGELCFNGDHEDHNWRARRRRQPEEVAGLLTALGEVAAARPDDALAFAQVVYAHTRLSDFQETLAVAGECTFVAWWCELLLGMVHERGGRPAEAAAYFRSALPDSDPALAALLTGTGDLLEGKDRSAYQRLTGRERSDFEQRFWWLTNPIWSIPGNDRWTTHIRRGVEVGASLDPPRGTWRRARVSTPGSPGAPGARGLVVANAHANPALDELACGQVPLYARLGNHRRDRRASVPPRGQERGRALHSGHLRAGLSGARAVCTVP